MTAVEKYFFTPLYYERGPFSVIAWWEARRLVFNLCVGGVGLLSLAGVALMDLLPPHAGTFPMPWALVLVYGVLANIGYTVGPVADFALRRLIGVRAATVGPVLFRYGFVFSIGLTLLPIPVAMLGWFARVVTATAF